MGIRIHKLIGYGLYDVETDDKDKIIDPRFNPVGYFGLDVYDQEEIKLNDFVKYIDELKEEDKEKYWQLEFEKKYFEEDNKRCINGFWSVVHHEPEFGYPNVVLFQSGHDDWQRYDDIIDYVEDTEQEKKLKVLSNPIYPYCNWIDRETGLTYKEKNGDKIDCLKIIQCLNGLNIGRRILEKCGFESEEEARKNIVPKVPQIIEQYCIWLKVFNNEETIRDLKPMVYTYWG